MTNRAPGASVSNANLAAAADAATTTSYTAASAAIIFGLTATDLAAVVGAVIAVATFLANIYFKRLEIKKQDAYRKEQLRLQAMGLPRNE